MTYNQKQKELKKLIEDAKELLRELKRIIIQSGGEPDEAEGIALMLASKVLYGDKVLEPQEDLFWSALISESCVRSAIATHAEDYVGMWEEMAERTPAFLRLATSYDREHDTHLADHIIDHIEAIAFRAAAVTLPVLGERELGPIRDYCGFLRKCVLELKR